MAPFVEGAFSGEGARHAGGRWNPIGVSVVYTSASLALAALELLVHADHDLLDTAAFVAIPADIPDDLAMTRLTLATLPPQWKHYPAPDCLQTLGGHWVRQGLTAVLAVPSVIVPEENNYVLNPAHPDFARIVIGTGRPFSFDGRLANH